MECVGAAEVAVASQMGENGVRSYAGVGARSWISCNTFKVPDLPVFSRKSD